MLSDNRALISKPNRNRVEGCCVCEWPLAAFCFSWLLLSLPEFRLCMARCIIPSRPRRAPRGHPAELSASVTAVPATNLPWATWGPTTTSTTCLGVIRRCSSTTPWSRDDASRSTRSSFTPCGCAADTKTSAKNTSCTRYQSIKRVRTEAIARPRSRRLSDRWKTHRPWLWARDRSIWWADQRRRRRYHRHRRRLQYRLRGRPGKSTRPNTPTKMSLSPFFRRETLRCLSLRFVNYSSPTIRNPRIWWRRSRTLPRTSFSGAVSRSILLQSACTVE